MSRLIDKKDRRLLYELSEDARQSNTQLSKKVGLSKNAIKYRIERLIRMGVIKKFSVLVDIGALNMETYSLMIKLNSEIYSDSLILDYFRKHPFSDWVAVLSGEWDILVEFITFDLTHLQNSIQKIVCDMGEKIHSYEVHITNKPLRIKRLVREIYKDFGPKQKIMVKK
ncbi:Lrp/AsnC family transcriptional regulator, partial [Candidatus Pacearchaeota archaeon]